MHRDPDLTDPVLADPFLVKPRLAKPVLALFEPDIPQNTGTALRTCACLGFDAAIIEPAAFPVSDRAFRRAGLDYLSAVHISRHDCFAAFEAWRRAAGKRLLLLTTAGSQSHTDWQFHPDDVLLVGRESAGVTPAVHEAADAQLRIAMLPGLRSLNVAVAAAIAMGEWRRQIGFDANTKLATGTDVAC